jgi:hypothetical protein
MHGYKQPDPLPLIIAFAIICAIIGAIATYLIIKGIWL